MKTLQNLSISKKLALLTGIMMLSVLTIALFSYWAISDLANQSNADAVAAAQTKILVIAFASLIIGVVCSWLVSKNIVAPLKTVLERLEMLRSVCVTGLEKATSAMAVGDLSIEIIPQTPPIKNEAVDEIGILSRTFDALHSQMVKTINSFKDSRNVLVEVLAENNSLSKAAESGDVSIRGNSAKFQGVYRELINGMNNTLEAISEPIIESSQVLERIAARDLSVHMLGEYKGDFAKIKTSVNTAVENLSESLLQITSGAEQVASAANEISSGSQNLAQGASEQAATLEEVSSNLQEISSVSRQNAANSKEARSLSDAARTSAGKGMTNMRRLSDAVNLIKNSSDSTAKIVKTIEEIAFQTNLLALNAAVEAARAGDAGKGFAVVAEEVRNLAMRSAEAAKQTAQLIEESVKNTENGVSLNQEVLSNLDEINGQIERVTVVISEITAASEQQSQGVEQINTSIEQMNVVTQAAAANSEQSASAAEELSGQSQEMLSLIGNFHLSKQGTTARQPAAIAKPRLAPKTRNSASSAFVAAKAKNGNGHSKTNGNGHGLPKTASQVIPFEDMDDEIFKDF